MRPSITVKARRSIEPAGITIVSLMDAMTIVLCFLLQNFKAQMIQVTPGEDLRAATSTVARGLREIVPVYIMRSSIQLERMNERNHLEMGKLVNVHQEGTGAARTFSVAASEKEGGDVGFVISKVKDELVRRIKLEDEKAKARGSVDGRPARYERVLAVIADREITGRLLMEVLTSAMQAGYEKFKFVVISPNVGG